MSNKIFIKKSDIAASIQLCNAICLHLKLPFHYDVQFRLLNQLPTPHKPSHLGIHH